MVMDDETLLGTAEACALLGVKPETLYAYVSRGLLQRRRANGRRGSLFDPAEVDRLAARGRQRAARRGRELRIASAITRVDPDGHRYRGHDARRLARSAGYERVAELLWTGALPARVPRWEADPALLRLARAVQRPLPRGTAPFDRLRLVVAALAGADPYRTDLRADAVHELARRLVATAVAALPPRLREPRTAGIAAQLWTRLASEPATPARLAALDAALALLADHELAGSTFAVRIAAAFRADPYGAVGAGLGVLGGAWHGAASIAVEGVLREIAGGLPVARVVGERLARGEKLPGLGHFLYPHGDPRARALLALVRRAAPGSPRLAHVDAYLAAGRARRFPPANVDVAVAGLTHVFDFVPGAGEAIFAVARMAGWIAHALEEYAAPSDLRPRAIYVGPRQGAGPGRRRPRAARA